MPVDCRLVGFDGIANDRMHIGQQAKLARFIARLSIQRRPEISHLKSEISDVSDLRFEISEKLAASISAFSAHDSRIQLNGLESSI
jgi:hypothetical protein